jgi:hypothetical protein
LLLTTIMKLKPILVRLAIGILFILVIEVLSAQFLVT